MGFLRSWRRRSDSLFFSFLFSLFPFSVRVCVCPLAIYDVEPAARERRGEIEVSRYEVMISTLELYACKKASRESFCCVNQRPLERMVLS